MRFRCTHPHETSRRALGHLLTCSWRKTPQYPPATAFKNRTDFRQIHVAFALTIRPIFHESVHSDATAVVEKVTSAVGYTRLMLTHTERHKILLRNNETTWFHQIHRWIAVKTFEHTFLNQYHSAIILFFRHLLWYSGTFRLLSLLLLTSSALSSLISFVSDVVAVSGLFSSASAQTFI